MFKIFKKNIHPQIRTIGDALKISHLQPPKLINWGDGKMIPEPPCPPMGDGSRLEKKIFLISEYEINLKILYDKASNVERMPSCLEYAKEITLKKADKYIALTDDEQKFLRQKIEKLCEPRFVDNRNILDEDFDENDCGNCKTGLPPAPPMPKNFHDEVQIDPPEKEIKG